MENGCLSFTKLMAEFLVYATIYSLDSHQVAYENCNVE